MYYLLTLLLSTTTNTLCFHILLPKVDLLDLLDLLDVVVVMIHVNSAARATVPIVAIPVAMIHALGAILINQ